MKKLKVWLIQIDGLILKVWFGIKEKNINYLILLKGRIKSVVGVIKNFMYILLKKIKENIVQRFVPIKPMPQNFQTLGGVKVIQCMAVSLGTILMVPDNIDTLKEDGEDLRRSCVKIINVKSV